jgi:hypothetical protein
MKEHRTETSGGIGGQWPVVSGQWPVVSGRRVASGERRVASELQQPKTQDQRPKSENLQISKSPNLQIPLFPLLRTLLIFANRSDTVFPNFAACPCLLVMRRSIVFLLIMSLASASLAEDVPGALLTPAAQRGIERGLAWLAAAQHDDGGFGAGQYRGNTAVTALAGMAMLSAGGAPGRGPYGRPLDRVVECLLAHAQPSGLISSPESGRGPMYEHGFATLFLAECYGTSRRDELREKLAKAVELIVRSQNDQGGWRYQPVRGDADVSVTACELMALRAARNAGLAVPAETIDRAVAYLKRCQNADGGFVYMLEKGGESAPPRSAAALAALNSAGLYDGPEIEKCLGYLERFPPGNAAANDAYYYYDRYYAAQVFWMAGGQRWRRWYPAVRDELLARQRPDGSWEAAQEGNHCATAMALVVLQVPNDCQPFFQR